jgi:hypothetical protein
MGDTAAPRNTFATEPSKGTLRKLHQEPDTEEEESRHFDKREEKEEGDDGENANTWLEQKIGTKNSCNRPAGTYHRISDRGCRVNVRETRSNANQHVEHQMADVPETIFNIDVRDASGPYCVAERNHDRCMVAICQPIFNLPFLTFGVVLLRFESITVMLLHERNSRYRRVGT